MNKQIIFVHGYTASSKADWYPNIRPLLDSVGWDYSIPDLPGGNHPISNQWVSQIHDEVQKTSKPIVLVGHSLGTRAILLYLDKYKTPVNTVILISPLSNDIANAQRNNGESYPDFFEQELNLKKIKDMAKKWIVIHSRDDQDVPYQQGETLANELVAQVIPFVDRGHFYDPSDAPIIFNILQKELS